MLRQDLFHSILFSINMRSLYLFCLLIKRYDCPLRDSHIDPKSRDTDISSLTYNMTFSKGGHWWISDSSLDPLTTPEDTRQSLFPSLTGHGFELFSRKELFSFTKGTIFWIYFRNFEMFNT